MGLGITPLATLVLASSRPEHAGAASGALAAAQNLGNALGVAVIGVVFFGAVDNHGFGGALELGVGVLVAVAGLSAPRPPPPPPPPPRSEMEFSCAYGN